MRGISRRQFIGGVVGVVGAFGLPVFGAGRVRRHPNIIFFMADDMGIGDTSAYQDWTGIADDGQIYTPSLERLARMGIRFTDAHTPSTVCSPTRYALLTGRYSWRSSLKHSVLWGPQADPLIQKDRPTIATMLRGAGYNTGMSGKWHVGLRYRTSAGKPATGWEDTDLRQPLEDCPLDHGFNYCFLTSRSHGTSASTGWIKGRKVISATGEGEKFVDGYSLDETGKQNFIHAMEFLEGHLETKATAETPFFLYYPSNSNHTPHTPSTDINGTPVKGRGRLVNGSRQGSVPKSTLIGSKKTAMKHSENRIDYVYENDVAVGELLKFLKATDDPRSPGDKLIDNTLVIFTSDNGSEKGGRDSVGPLRGKKALIYEGGHRVPFIALWKKGGIGDGNDNTPGRTSDQVFGLNDMFATFAALTDQSMAPFRKWAQDSENMLDVLLGKTKRRPPLVMHDDYSSGPALALRDGPWKLIVSEDLVRGDQLKPIALFNLQKNRMERPAGNLINDPEQSARVKKMSGTLREIFDQGFDPEIIYIRGSTKPQTKAAPAEVKSPTKRRKGTGVKK